MAKLKSKYVAFGTMSFVDFSRGQLGTVANFFLTSDIKSREEVSKTLKSSCFKAGSSCEIKTTNVMVKVDNIRWEQSHILEVTITEVAKKVRP